MVRTYRQDKYQLVSPWEKAMRTADSEEGRPINTGKRVYSDMKVTQTSLEHNSGQKNLKLPPINEDPQQMISFLGEEVGKTLSRSKELIKKIIKEFVLYDPSDTGLMSKSSAFEILQRYKVPRNENYQKKILAFFIDQQQPGKINYKNLKEFFENSQKIQLEKVAFSQQQKKHEEEDNASVRTDNTRGRYDSTTTMNTVQNKPRKAHKQAFAERRDVGLLFEIEKALKNTHKDPVDLLENLEEALRSTCKNDDFLTNNGHVKSLVSKHELPINTALTLKCIERLDPHDIGKIEWPKFMEFLRKAIGASPRRTPQKPPPPQPQPQPTEYVPTKPAWETRQPLSSISQPNNDMKSDYNYTPQENVRSSWNTPEQPGGWTGNNNPDDTDNGIYKEASAPPFGRDNFAPYNYLTASHNNNDNLLHNGYDDDNNYSNNDNMNHYDGDGARQEDYDDQYPTTDSDIEAAFAKNIEEIRQTYQQEEEEEAPKYNFEGTGERTELYKRVANALEDKAKPTQGMLLTNDVRKIINYYNLLFDANFPLDQINSILQRFSTNDQIHSQQVIDMFGKQII